MAEVRSTPGTIQKLITPHDQFIRGVFEAKRSYFIDIYQREYKWSEKQVKTLLNDLEVRFEVGNRDKSDPHAIKQYVLEHYEPYFLNTYLTHTSATSTSIVDGQQRLTTLLLMLIKLYRILLHVDSVETSKGKTFRPNALSPLIFEEDDFGTATRFKIYNPNREQTLRTLVDGNAFNPADETQKRLRDNFLIISSYFDSFLKSETDPTGYDLVKLTYYLAYLLDRVSIVEIRIERQDNVAMIFEVVNDRGLKLKSYEILKGKLIGSLPLEHKEELNRIWVELQNLYYQTVLRNTTESAIDLDDFFRIYFRSKFANSEYDYKAFEGDYHYEIYRRPEIRTHFGEFRDSQVLFDRVRNDIQYFARLFQELRTDYTPTRDHLFYNKLMEQNQQYLLVMSAVQLNDSQKEEKIRVISAKFDQLHVILRVLGVYDSNSFQDLVYILNRDIRNKTAEECRQVFDALILKALKDEERLEQTFSGSVADVFTMERFIGVRNASANFSKYVLMRIDRWLAELLDKPSYCRSALADLENRFNKSNRRIYGMHLEHIYAWNDPNRALFTDPATGIFDSNGFDLTRNLLGMVLLLKDKQNLSSGNDVYKDKIQDYARSDVIWNQILAGHLPSVDIARLPAEFQSAAIQPDAAGTFPKDKVVVRQILFFEAIKRIWANV